MPIETTNPGDSPAAWRLMRAKEVIALTGWSRTTIWRKVRAGKFVCPVELDKGIAWRSDEVEAWMKSLPRVAYGKRKSEVVRERDSGNTL